MPLLPLLHLSSGCSVLPWLGSVPAVPSDGSTHWSILSHRFARALRSSSNRTVYDLGLHTKTKRKWLNSSLHKRVHTTETLPSRHDSSILMGFLWVCSVVFGALTLCLNCCSSTVVRLGFLGIDLFVFRHHWSYLGLYSFPWLSQ